jgi:hypothetical protein
MLVSRGSTVYVHHQHPLAAASAASLIPLLHLSIAVPFSPSHGVRMPSPALGSPTPVGRNFCQSLFESHETSDRS